MADTSVRQSVGGSHNTGGFTSVVGVSSFGDSSDIVLFDSVGSDFDDLDIDGLDIDGGDIDLDGGVLFVG
jgi:hypothetical protein